MLGDSTKRTACLLLHVAVAFTFQQKHAVSGCLAADEGRGRAGSCSFQRDFCNWRNSDSVEWRRGGDTFGGNVYAGVDMRGLPQGTFARLASPFFCATTNIQHSLSFRYNLRDRNHCKLSVYVFTPTDVADRYLAHELWSKSIPTGSGLTEVSSPVKIPGQNSSFRIVFRAEKLTTDPQYWGQEKCSIIQLDSIQFRSTPLTTTTLFAGSSSPSSLTSTEELTSTTSLPKSSSASMISALTPKANVEDGSSETEDDSSDGLAAGVGVSIGVSAVVVAVVVVVIAWRRTNKNNNNKNYSTGTLNCCYKKSEPPSEMLTPGVANATYSPDSDPSSVHFATNGVENTYAKVNKPEKGGDVYSVPNKGPKAAASRGAANSDVFHELEGDDAEADHYSVPDDADSSKRKGDNGYKLAAAKLSMAPNTTPRNIGLNKAKGTAGSKPSRGPNPGAETEDEYNKLAIQTPRMASPAIPDTDNTYNHLDEHKHGVPTDQTGGNEYSLAKPDEAVSSKSTGNPRRQDYVNVNPNTSPREDEYHSLEFDSGHAPNSAVRGTGTTGGQDEYNHLQADGPGFKVQGDDDHYNALDFDSHGQVQKGDDGMVYSHLDDDQSAV